MSLKLHKYQCPICRTAIYLERCESLLSLICPIVDCSYEAVKDNMEFVQTLEVEITGAEGATDETCNVCGDPMETHRHSCDGKR